MRFITANQVFPSCDAPVANGILVVDDNNMILDLLSPARLDYEITDLEHYPGFLCPGFINAHCHLELSWAKGLIPRSKGLDHFLRDLDRLRKQISDDDVYQAIEKEGDGMLKSGTVAAGDITNGLTTLSYKKKSSIVFHTFAEVFGSNPASAGRDFNRLLGVYQSFHSAFESRRVSLTPHSTYSLSDELLWLIAGHAEANRSLLSIHHQENEDENRFFQDGSGAIAARRKMFNPMIPDFEPEGKRPVEHISKFFPKEQPMILVHNTVSREQDICLAEDHFEELYWCLCPNANLYIESKLPDVDLFRKKGCRMLLGTDSLASNTSLSILEEIKTLSSNFPGIPLCEMIAWANRNGAEAFKMDHLGSFERGKRPGVVWIENVDTENMALLPSSRSSLLIMPGDDSIH